MVAMSMKLLGVKKTTKALDKQIKYSTNALAAAIYEEGYALIGESIEIVPVETARLKQSHYVTPPQDTMRGTVVEVGYGTEYAVKQHEETSFNHKPGKRAKFLSSVAAKRRDGYAKRIMERTKKWIRKKIGVVPLNASVPTKPKVSG